MTSSTDRTRWAALHVLCAGMLMIVLDATIVNVALPSIQDDLGFSASNLAWVVNAYLIAFGGLLLLAGRAGDLLGQRRVFLSGLTLFTAASALCAVSQTEEMLIAARFIQGIGGALTSAVILGMIVTMFPSGGDQAKALGVYGFVASAGGSIGLLAGGVLTDAINWHWIFFINLPIGLVTGLLAVRLVPARPGLGLSAGADLPGAALLTAGLMLGVYSILTKAPLAGAIAIVLVAAFLVRQTRVANPLMPLRLLRSRDVSGANVAMGLLVVGMFGMFFLGALYLQRVLGYSPLQVGLSFLPSSLVMGYVSLRLSARFAPRTVAAPALLIATAGLALFIRVPVDGSYVVDVLGPSLLIGVGMGLSMPAMMTLAMSGVAPQDAGLASGLVNTTVQVGGAIGLAVLATLAAHRTGSSQAPEALLSGYHLAFVIGASAMGAATLVTFWLTSAARVFRVRDVLSPGRV